MTAKKKMNGMWMWMQQLSEQGEGHILFQKRMTIRGTMTLAVDSNDDGKNNKANRSTMVLESHGTQGGARRGKAAATHGLLSGAWVRIIVKNAFATLKKSRMPF